jgi:hypothetical protein
MSVEGLIEAIEDMAVFCGEAEYIELVSNNELLQTSPIYTTTFINSIFNKMNYYHAKLNFFQSKIEHPDCVAKLCYVEAMLNNFYVSNNYSDKLVFAKNFHSSLVDILEILFMAPPPLHPQPPRCLHYH